MVPVFLHISFPPTTSLSLTLKALARMLTDQNLTLAQKVFPEIPQQINVCKIQ